MLIRHLFENWDGSGVPDHLHQGRIPLGSRMLRVLVDFFDDLDAVSNPAAHKKTLATLQSRMGLLYDLVAFLALVQYVQHHLDASLAHNRRYLRVEDLRPGMNLAADLLTTNGSELLAHQTTQDQGCAT